MKPNATLAILLALLVGGAILVTLRLGGGGSSRATGDAAANDALAEQVRVLARSQERTAAALERLETALARFGAPEPRPAARETISSEPPPSFEELIASLDALRETFETESRRTQTLIRDSSELGGESLVDVRDRNATNDWTNLGLLEEQWRADERQADRSQYLQTARDLLREYGPPTAIYRPSDGMTFAYRRHPQGEAGPVWYFRLKDGIVIEFFIEDEEKEGSDGG